jgi:hypothetical protein
MSSNYIGGEGPIVSWGFTERCVWMDDKGNATEYYNGKGDVIKDTIITLKRGEVYRYGIVLYDNEGTKSSVNWIADIMVPEKPNDEYSPGLVFSFSRYNRHEYP